MFDVLPGQVIADQEEPCALCLTPFVPLVRDFFVFEAPRPTVALCQYCQYELVKAAFLSVKA